MLDNSLDGNALMGLLRLRTSAQRAIHQEEGVPLLSRICANDSSSSLAHSF